MPPAGCGSVRRPLPGSRYAGTTLDTAGRGTQAGRFNAVRRGQQQCRSNSANRLAAGSQAQQCQ